jgi:hypothetical protein
LRLNGATGLNYRYPGGTEGEGEPEPLLLSDACEMPGRAPIFMLALFSVSLIRWYPNAHPLRHWSLSGNGRFDTTFAPLARLDRMQQ